MKISRRRVGQKDSQCPCHQQTRWNSFLSSRLFGVLPQRNWLSKRPKLFRDFTHFQRSSCRTIQVAISSFSLCRWWASSLSCGAKSDSQGSQYHYHEVEQQVLQLLVIEKKRSNSLVSRINSKCQWRRRTLDKVVWLTARIGWRVFLGFRLVQMHLETWDRTTCRSKKHLWSLSKESGAPLQTNEFWRSRFI